MAFSMTEYIKNKGTASGSNESGAPRFSMAEYVTGTRYKPADMSAAIAMGRKREKERNPITTEQVRKSAETDFLDQRLGNISKGMIYDRKAFQNDMNRTLYPLIRADLKETAQKESSSAKDRVKALVGSSASNVGDYAKITKNVMGTPAQDGYEAFMRENTDYNRYMFKPDFQQYSTQGANIANPSFTDAQGKGLYFGKRPGAAEVGNIVTFSRDNMDAINERLGSDDKSEFVGNALYGYMTDDEVAIYNYILAKEGKKEAQIYLDSIEETLNARYGGKIAEGVEKTKGSILHPFMVAGTATSAGLDQYVSGVKQAFNEYEQPTSATQFAGQSVRQSQSAAGKFAYDAINTLSNMAPSILASYVAAGLGVPSAVTEWIAAGSIGLGSGGNAYKEALAEGRSRDEAKKVATLIGTSEAILSKLLSGIGAVGGLAPSKILPKVAAIEKAIWRVPAAAIVKIGGEEIEEILQLYLEPLYKTLIYGDKYDAPAVGEVAYTALLTLLTTGVLKGGEIMQYRTQEGARNAAGVAVSAAQDINKTKQKTGNPSQSVSDGALNASGQQVAKKAPVAQETEQKKATSGLGDPMQVLSEERRKAQAAQQNEKPAAETQRDVSESNTSIETLRNSIAESYENGTISAEEYDAAMESVYELESLDEASGDALDAYDPERLRRMEANDNGRSSVSDGSGERAASQSAGEQAGELAEGTGRDQSREVQAQRAASRRDDVSRYYESTGRQAVSAREYFGNNKVNKVSTVQEVPAEMVEADSELQAIAEDIRAMGLTPHFFVGDARLQNGNSVDGMIRDGDVFIRVDGDDFSATHNWDHEKSHAIFRQSPGIDAELYGKIVGRGKAARRKLHQTMQRYREAYHGIYDVDENGNELWNDTVQEMILQEILADAYAGKDTFAQGVEEYADIARDAASQIESRSVEVRGPPEGDGEARYSIGEIVDKNNNSYGIGVHLDSTLLDNLTPNERKVMVKERIKELGGEVFTAYDNSGNAVNIMIAKPSARFENQNSKIKPVNNDLTTKFIGNEVKQEAVVLIDELIATSKFRGPEPAKHTHGWLDNDGQNDWDVWTTYIQDKKNTIWELALHIANTVNGEKIIYDVIPIKKVGQSGNSDTSLPKGNIAQEKMSVKADGSFSADKAAQESGADPIEAMPAKARQVMERAEKKLQRSLSDVLNLPKKMPEGVLEGVSREISREFLETGTVSDETIDRTFEQVYSAIESEVERQHGVDAEDYRQWAERDYIAEISKHLAEMRLVKRYAEEKAQQKEQSEQDKAMTLSDLKKVYTDLKAARRVVDKAVARNLLTEQDNRRVNQLLRGDIDLDMLQPGVDNVRGITEVYNAKLEYEKFARQIRRWNAARKENLRALADKLLATASDWKDKGSGWLYSRETMERNIRDIVPDKKIAQEIIDTLFKPVHDGAAAANRMKNQYRDRVRKLELSRKVEAGNTISEAAAVQLLGEAEDNIRHLEQNRFLSERDGKSLEDWRGIVRDLWEQNPSLDAGKIRRAVKEFREIYDELFEQMNEVRMRNGYEPVNYRKGYFPHFQSKDGDGILGKFGKSLGINTAAMQLPTTINGMTHNFKPGIQWFGSAQQRMGVNTSFDALEGFDSYIEGVADVIHQTDNIQRLRAFAAQVRYRTSEEGIRKQVDAIQNDNTIAPEDKQNRIEKLYADGKFELGNLAVEMDEYTNLLAGKKSRHDRDMEQKLGRRMYAIMKALESRVAANMVAINPGSWLTNFIPITQGAAALDTRSLLAGMWDTLKAYKQDDGFVAASSFLTNRRGSDPIVRTWSQAASAKLSTPMELIDSFTADVLVRSRYNENIRRGMSEEAALADADAFAADVMADRSKGATPTLFSQTNPLTKLLTQFQLEVNNQLSFVFKDMPREAKKKGKMALALQLLKFALGAYIYDELYEWLIGRRPALDPINLLSETVGDLTGYKLDGFKVVETERTGVYDAGVNLAGSIAEEMPFIGSLLGGGRLPISSALPDVGNLWRAITDSDWDGKKRLATAAKELAKPATYLALPFGGGQVKKAVEGISAVARGGSYSVDSKGDDLLQYPIYNSTPGEAGLNAVRAMLFGKSSLPEAREWVENDFDSLGVRQTKVYQTLQDSGVDTRQVYQTIRDWETVGNNDLLSSFERGIRQRKLVSEMAIPDQQKLEVYHLLSGSNADGRVKKFQRMMGNGLTWSEIISAYDKQQELNTDEVLKASEKASLFAEWAFRNLTIEKALEVVNELKFYITMPANASQEDLTAALNKTNLSVMEKRSVWADYSELYGWKAKSPW